MGGCAVMGRSCAGEADRAEHGVSDGLPARWWDGMMPARAQVRLVRVAPRALAMAPVVDMQGYSFPVEVQRNALPSVVRLQELAGRATGQWSELGGCLRGRGRAQPGSVGWRRSWRPACWPCVGAAPSRKHRPAPLASRTLRRTRRTQGSTGLATGTPGSTSTPGPMRTRQPTWRLRMLDLTLPCPTASLRGGKSTQVGRQTARYTCLALALRCHRQSSGSRARHRPCPQNSAAGG